MTKAIGLDEPRIELVDPADVEATDNANPAEREDIDFLMASLDESGQRVPVLLARHDSPGYRYRYLDGHGRGYCLGKLGRMMQAIVIAGDVTDSELIEIKFQSNVLRRAMSLDEIAADTLRYIELTNCKQKEVAYRLKVSETTISRALALANRIPEQCRSAARELGPHFVSLISPLRDAAKIEDAIRFAKTPSFEGKRPSREEITEHVGQLRGKPAAAGKAKRLKFTAGGRAFEIEEKPDDTPDSLAAALRAVAEQFHVNRKYPLDVAVSIIATAAELPKAEGQAKPAKRPARSPKPEPQASAIA